MADLDQLLQDGVIDEVVGLLKTGKEAELWIVRHQNDYVAAKLYKERHARSFRNNAAYKEGRTVRNSRTARAIARGSRFGQASEEEAWKSAESDALYKLHAAGVRVPTPVLFYEGVLLMELVIDPEGHPAPRMIDAAISAEQAASLYEDLRGQIIKMLCAETIHGDLSPYNILMSWQGPTIIDFPQVISAAHNQRAEQFFHRDVQNVREHLSAFAPQLARAAGDASEIWRAYVRRELTPDFVPTGRAPPPQRFGGGPRAPNEGFRDRWRGNRQGRETGRPAANAGRGNEKGPPKPGEGKHGQQQPGNGGRQGPPGEHREGGNRSGPPGGRERTAGRMPEVSYRGIPARTPTTSEAAPSNGSVAPAQGSGATQGHSGVPRASTDALRTANPGQPSEGVRRRRRRRRR